MLVPAVLSGSLPAEVCFVHKGESIAKNARDFFISHPLW